MLSAQSIEHAQAENTKHKFKYDCIFRRRNTHSVMTLCYGDIAGVAAQLGTSRRLVELHNSCLGDSVCAGLRPQ